jgi:hypothetical protein
VWLLTLGQEYQVAKRTKLLSELYFVSREEPGDPNRLAANIGFKHKLRDNLTVHAAIGKSGSVIFALDWPSAPRL